MSVIKKLGEGVEITKKVYFGEESHTGYINLRRVMGEDMCYDGEVAIEYPGEYESNGVFIVARADEKGLLNYSLDFGNKVYIIVQSRSFLGSEECPDECTKRIFVSPELRSIAEKSEYEGSYVDVSGDEREEGEMGGVVES